nr:unnamed protein product [Callosobruchus analis]
MMEDSTQENFAHFRYYEKTGRCELRFQLDVEVPDVGLLKEDVNAVRQSNDTISSLLGHIKNKMKKVILDNYAKDGIEVPVFIRGCNKDLNGSMKLGHLENIIYKDKSVILSIFGQDYTILFNTPFVKELKLLPILYEGCTTQPKFYAPFNDISEFVWYKSKDKVNWTEVGRGFKYNVKKEDVDHFLKLKCTPFNHAGLPGPTAEVISENPVALMGNFPKCPFEDRHQFTKDFLSHMELRVVTYNLLAERYTTIDGNYSYCDPLYLSMDYRKRLILKELLGYNADVICLQEVDMHHYHKFFGPEMKDHSYIPVFHKKGYKLPEGLGCFVRAARYKLLKSLQIVYSEEVKKKPYSYIWKYLSNNKKLADDFLKQYTSLQVVILESPTHILIVGNTHLYYHPDANAIRLLQANIATAQLDFLKNKYFRAFKKDVHVIFCGDFNSHHAKSLYPYMIEGRIHPKHADCKEGMYEWSF